MAETYYGLFDCELMFSTGREFRQKKGKIRKAFLDMSIKEKVVYRLYIYSRPLLKEKQMDNIWEYLIRDYTI